MPAADRRQPAARSPRRSSHKYYGGQVETNAFAVADAAIAGRYGEALIALRHALDSGADPVPMVAAFAMKVRTMAKVSGARGGGPQLASTLGLAPWQVDRARRDLAGWTDAGLGGAIEALAATDAAGQGRRARSGVRARAPRRRHLGARPRVADSRRPLRRGGVRGVVVSRVQVAPCVRAPSALSAHIDTRTHDARSTCDDATAALTARHRCTDDDGPAPKCGAVEVVQAGVRAQRPASRWPTCGSRPGSGG